MLVAVVVEAVMVVDSRRGCDGVGSDGDGDDDDGGSGGGGDGGSGGGGVVRGDSSPWLKKLQVHRHTWIQLNYSLFTQRKPRFASFLVEKRVCTSPSSSVPNGRHAIQVCSL